MLTKFERHLGQHMGARLVGIGVLAGTLSLVTPVFGQTSTAERGYKGVAWGTPCGKALEALESKGMQFSEDWKARTLQGEVMTEWLAFAPSETVRGGHCNFQEVTKAAFPEGGYGEATGSAGLVEVSAYCRAGAFVGVAFSASLDGDEKKGVSLLKRTAGQPTSTTTVRWDLATERHIMRVATLAPRKDSARFLVTDVVTISSDERKVTYSVMAKTESDAVQTAQVKCSRAEARRERREAVEASRQARSVVE